MRISNGIAINVFGLAFDLVTLQLGAPIVFVAFCLIAHINGFIVSACNIGEVGELSFMNWWNREWFR